MFLPVEENVDFVPSVGLVANLRVDELVHTDLLAKAQSEKDR